ncbi:MAG: hypothetical protein AAFQ91_13220 [Cyanobacteria bacterium J06621_15]
MHHFVQGNIQADTDTTILLAFLHIIFALFYFTFRIRKLIKFGYNFGNLSKAIHIIQLIVIPDFLIISGFILFSVILQDLFLHKVLLSSQLILSAIFVYLSLKDFLVNNVIRKIIKFRYDFNTLTEDIKIIQLAVTSTCVIFSVLIVFTVILQGLLLDMILLLQQLILPTIIAYLSLKDFLANKFSSD